MNHLEAQSYIMPFIDGKVPVNKQSDFVLHMKNCKKCHEELEIYYTLMVGMRQLDNKQSFSTDFKRDLETELTRMGHRVKTKKRLSVSAFSIVFTTIIVLGVFLYAGGLTEVYSYEQRTKLASQGENYFNKSLEDNLMLDYSDRVYKSDEIIKSAQITDFQRIDGYVRMENDLERIYEIGEGIKNVEASAD